MYLESHLNLILRDNFYEDFRCEATSTDYCPSAPISVCMSVCMSVRTPITPRKKMFNSSLNIIELLIITSVFDNIENKTED